MSQVIAEGRDAVRGLRATSANTDDLENTFSQVGHQVGNGNVKDYRVVVNGTPVQLRPIIRDEAYRFGREALVNALHHSHAAKIEVQLEYAPKHLRIVVRDDGAGIDEQIWKRDETDTGDWRECANAQRTSVLGCAFPVVSMRERK